MGADLKQLSSIKNFITLVFQRQNVLQMKTEHLICLGPNCLPFSENSPEASDGQWTFVHLERKKYQNCK